MRWNNPCAKCESTKQAIAKTPLCVSVFLVQINSNIRCNLLIKPNLFLQDPDCGGLSSQSVITRSAQRFSKGKFVSPEMKAECIRVFVEKVLLYYLCVPSTCFAKDSRCSAAKVVPFTTAEAFVENMASDFAVVEDAVQGIPANVVKQSSPRFEVCATLLHGLLKHGCFRGEVGNVDLPGNTFEFFDKVS